MMDMKDGFNLKFNVAISARQRRELCGIISMCSFVLKKRLVKNDSLQSAKLPYNSVRTYKDLEVGKVDL